MAQTFQSFERVGDHLYWWQAFDSDMQAVLSSAALKTIDGVILFDPVALPPREQSVLRQAGLPKALLLTNENHARDSAWFRRNWKTPVYASVAARFEHSFQPDVRFGLSERLPGGLVPIGLPGVCDGETAYLDSRGRGTLIQGDSLINIKGLAFLPAEYSNDAARSRLSIETLRRYSFDTLTTAHGRPVANAGSALRKLLEG